MSELYNNKIDYKMKYPDEVDFKSDYRGEKLSENKFKVYQKFTAKNGLGVNLGGAEYQKRIKGNLGYTKKISNINSNKISFHILEQPHFFVFSF